MMAAPLEATTAARRAAVHAYAERAAYFRSLARLGTPLLLWEDEHSMSLLDPREVARLLVNAAASEQVNR